MWKKQVIRKIYKWPKVIEKEIENLNGPITIKDAELVVKRPFFLQWKVPGCFSPEFEQMLFPVFNKLFQKTEKKDNNTSFILSLKLLASNQNYQGECDKMKFISQSHLEA